MKRAAIVCFLATASCVRAPVLPEAPEAELIRIEMMPGFGGTLSYDLRVASDGRARLRWNVEGYPWTNTQQRDFKVSPQSFEAFHRVLAPYRPTTNMMLSHENPDCDYQITDQPMVRVTWRGRGPKAWLQYDYGCNALRNKALVKTLTDAPKAVVPLSLAKLPIW